MDESRVVPQGFLESAPTLRRLIRNRSLWALNLPPLFYPVVLGLIISLCATALIGPIMIFEKVCITLLLLSSIFIAYGKLARREHPRRASVRAAQSRLRRRMKSGEFDKKLHPEVLATAEEVAVSYETLMRARGEVSPGMERAQSAARAGLEEVVLVLAECSQPTPGMPPIVDVLQAAKVTIFGQPASRPLTSRETAALGRIGKLARDLGALAAEAAQFSLEPAGSPDAALQVREALGALRLEREARDELERELRQNRG